MIKIKGITVRLINLVETGEDNIGSPIFEEIAVEIPNVLVVPASSDDTIDSVSLYGDRAVYMLGIPKGDTHNWENQIVEFFGCRWKTLGIPLEGIEDNIPLKWNKKVMVERYG